jgi:membrane protein
LYLNWLVLLLGASIAFYHQNPAYQTSSGARVKLGFHRQVTMALEIMRLLGESYQQGENRWSLESLADHFALPVETVNAVLLKLQSQGLVVQTCDEATHLLPGRDLETIFVKQIFDIVGGDLVQPQEVGLPVDQAVLDIVNQFDSLISEHLARMSIKDILARSGSVLSDNPDSTISPS